MAKPDTPDLEQVRDQLKAEIREGRETLKDLRHEIKQARELVPLLAEELFAAEVQKQVAKLGAATKQAMDAATNKVIAEFDKLRDLLMGGSRRDRAQGKPTIPEIAEAVATLKEAGHGDA